MKKLIFLAAVLLGTIPVSRAGVCVSVGLGFSVPSVGVVVRRLTPIYYAPQPVYYAAPAPVYVAQPAPVYVPPPAYYSYAAPAPVYVAPPSVVVATAPLYYGPYRYGPAYRCGPAYGGYHHGYRR